MRNAMDAQEVAVGWWPGDPKYEQAAFFGYAYPAPDNFPGAALSVPGARWESDLGLYVLDWEDIRASSDPHALALDFARAVFRHACLVCAWDPSLLASAEGNPPPVA